MNYTTSKNGVYAALVSVMEKPRASDIDPKLRDIDFQLHALYDAAAAQVTEQLRTMPLPYEESRIRSQSIREVAKQESFDLMSQLPGEVCVALAVHYLYELRQERTLRRFYGEGIVAFHSAELATKTGKNGRRLIGATARSKIAKEERAKVEAEMRAMLSAAGVQGGKARSDRYEPIKQWALDQAKTMKASHKQIAVKLSASLPSHLADISQDPQRLIYDALRALTKGN